MSETSDWGWVVRSHDVTFRISRFETHELFLWRYIRYHAGVYQADGQLKEWLTAAVDKSNFRGDSAHSRYAMKRMHLQIYWRTLSEVHFTLATCFSYVYSGEETTA
jgi:hypothetical protein